MEAAEDLFLACDLDNDGFIDREELKYAVSKRSGKELDDVSLDKLLKSLDSDGDGKISYDDFILQFDSLAGSLSGDNEELDDTPLPPPMSPGEFEEKMRWIFSFFDQDGDGVVTVDELRALLNEIKTNNNLESAGEEIENFVQQLDKEDRGHIGFTHFFRAIQRIIDPTEDPLPLYADNNNGSKPKKRRPTSWVAPESIVSMIRKRSDSTYAESETGVAGLSAQVEQYKRTIETLKGESDQFLARAEMLSKKLTEVKENNEKLSEENLQLNEKLQQNKKSIKQNEKLQKQNRELEANLDMLKSEVTKMKEQSRDLKRTCTKLKIEKDLLNDDLYIKRRDLQTAEEKLADVNKTVAQIGPALQRSLSTTELLPNVSELEKFQEENHILRTTLEREQKKVAQMMKLLNEDNEQLKHQLKEDNALIESSNQIIKKLRQALEDHTASTFNSDSAYKNSLLSELEHDVVVRLTPRITEIEDELSRSLNGPTSPIGQLLRTSLSRGSIPSYINGSPSISSNPASPSVSSPIATPNTSTLFSPNSSMMNDESPRDLTDVTTSMLGSSGENGVKLQKSDSKSRLLRRVNSEENASSQINMFDEIDELEEKLAELEDKYSKLEKDYLKAQTENVNLRSQNIAQDTIVRKLSFSNAPLPSFHPASSTPTLSAHTRSQSPSHLLLNSTPPTSINHIETAVRSSSPAPSPISAANPLSLSSSDATSLSPAPSPAVGSASPKAVPRLAINSTRPQTPPLNLSPQVKPKAVDLQPSTPLISNKEDDRKELLTALLNEVELALEPNEEASELVLAEMEKARDKLQQVKGKLLPQSAAKEKKKAAMSKEKEDTEKLKSELKSITEELNAAQQKLRALTDEQEEARKKYEADIQSEKARFEAERITLATEKETIAKDKETLQKEKETIAEEKSRVEKENVQFVVEREILQNEKGTLEKEKETLVSHKETLEKEKGTLEKEKETLVNQKETLEKEKETIQKEKETISAEKETIQKEKDTISAEKDSILAEKDTILAERDTVLAEKDTLLAERDTVLAEKDVILAEKARFEAENAQFAAENARYAAEKQQLQGLQQNTEKYTENLENLSDEDIKKQLEVEMALRVKLNEENEELKTANIVAEATLQKEASDARAMSTQLRTALVQLDAANGERMSAAQQLENSRIQMEAMRREGQEAQDRLHALERELSSLRTRSSSLSSSNSNITPTSPTTQSYYQQQAAIMPQQPLSQSQQLRNAQRKVSKGRIEMDNTDMMGGMGNIALNVHDDDTQEHVPLMDESSGNDKESSCCCTIC